MNPKMPTRSSWVRSWVQVPGDTGKCGGPTGARARRRAFSSLLPMLVLLREGAAAEKGAEEGEEEGEEEEEDDDDDIRHVSRPTWR